MKTTIISSNKSNGQITAKNANVNSVSKDEKPTVNALPQSIKEEINKEENPATETPVQDRKIETVSNSDVPATEHTKMEVKDDFQIHKPALSLEETIKVIKDLADKTAHRNTYSGYIDRLNAFVISQTDDDMDKKNDPSFRGCELTIRDGNGNVFTTYSASVIFGTVGFMKGRFLERLAEVESEIVIPV